MLLTEGQRRMKTAGTLILQKVNWLFYRTYGCKIINRFKISALKPPSYPKKVATLGLMIKPATY